MTDCYNQDELESAFAELQQNLDEQETAERETNRIGALRPGDSDYDAVRSWHAERKSAKQPPDEATKAELSVLSEQWLERRDELATRETELYDILDAAGYDVRAFYREYRIKPKVQRAATDPDEVAMRASVDALLSKTRPPQVSPDNGSVRPSVTGGASGCVGNVDEEDLAEVDVLDAAALTLENDRPPDKLRVYTEDNDNHDMDEPVTEDGTGAHWFNGFRMDPCLCAILQNHQLGAADACLEALRGGGHGILVAHGMGLGKTLTTMATLQAWSGRHNKARAVVCCPKSLVRQWYAEFSDWDSLITVKKYALTGEEADIGSKLEDWLKNGGVVIVGHDQFKLALDKFRINEHTIVVVDEAHVLKKVTTGMYAAIKNLPTLRRIFLTGSPVQNNLTEYYSLIQALAPGMLAATPADFNRLYCAPIQAGVGRDADKGAVATANATIKAMRSRLKEPDTACSAVVVHEQSSDILDGVAPRKIEFCLLHSCDHVVPDPSVIKERHNVLEAARNAKIEVILCLVESIRSHTDDNIVVFSTRNDLLRALQQREYGFMFTGRLNTKQRDTMIHEYPSKAGDIIYMATKAGGTGINLTSASRVILADASWNPVDDNQAVARCYRMGQTKPVFVYRLVADNTIEKGVHRMGIKKHALALRITCDADVQSNFTRDDLYALMAEPDDDAAAVPLCGCGCPDATLNAFDAARSDAAATFSIKAYYHDKSFSIPADGSWQLEDAEACDSNLEWNMYCVMSHYSARRGTREDFSTQLIGCNEYGLDDATLCSPHAPAFYEFTYLEDRKAKKRSMFEPAVCFAHDETAYLRLGPCIASTDASIFASPETVVFRLQYLELVHVCCPRCGAQLETLRDAVDNKESIKCSRCDAVFVYDPEAELPVSEAADDDMFDGLFVDTDDAGDEQWTTVPGDNRWLEYGDLEKHLPSELFDISPVGREPGSYRYRVAYYDETGGRTSSFSQPSAIITFGSEPI